jgi:hypothetical protein
MPPAQPVPQVQYVPQSQAVPYGQAAPYGSSITALQPAPTSHVPTPQSPVSVKSPERDPIDEEEERLDWAYLRQAPLREHCEYCCSLSRPCN